MLQNMQYDKPENWNQRNEFQQAQKNILEMV